MIAGVFSGGAIAAVGITYAICRFLFGDLRLLP